LKQLLFGYHPDWMLLIANRLDRDRYQPSFAPLDAVDLARFDAVLPLRIDHYRELETQAVWAGRKFVIPSPETVALCDDKLLFARWLEQRGFGAMLPQIYEGTAPYPHVRKPRRGEYGLGCRVVTTPGEEDAADEAWFTQAAVPGKVEYALHLLRVHGRTCYMQAVRYEMAGPLDVRSAANPPMKAALVDGAGAATLFEPVLAALDYAGTCCLNFKLIDRSPLLLEINPRFGGSLVYDINRYVGAYLAALEN
jgi:predicted ATP-grasp superfamily ATP-dependent carboligase